MIRWWCAWFFWFWGSLALAASVADFGAIPDDNQDDTAAFQAAVNWGGTVRVPTGTYDVAISGKTALVCSRSVRLVGDGRGASIIRTESELTATGRLFQFAPGVEAAVERLSLEGPAKCGEFYSRLLWHLAGPGGSLRVDRCALRGGTHGIIMEELGTAIDEPRMLILDSVFEVEQPILHTKSGRLDCVRSEFRRYGSAQSNQGHAIYVYRPVAAVIDSCVFQGNAGDGWDIHCYSPSVPGKGSLVDRDSEHTGTGHGILTHPDTLTVIRGCQLDGVSIDVQRGGAVISECSLRSRSQVKPWPSGPGAWSFRDCRFAE